MDPTLEIIRTCIDLMKADSLITSYVGNHIYDRVPEKSNNEGVITVNVPSPYISLGNTSFITDDYDCVDAAVINLQWNVWSWGDGEAYSSAQVRKIAFAVRKCLHKREIDLGVNGFLEITNELITYNRAADGITNQATLTFEAMIDLE